VRAWLVLAAALFCACGGVGEAPSAAPPNIVLIIGDDHGYPDFGFMGSEIVQTPHLDRLAASGTVFPSGYSTASVCRPSLLSLLTGLHPLQFDRRQERLRERGVPPSPETPLRESYHTLPALLAERGYASFQSGKYQEGSYRNAGFTHGMTELPGDAGRKQGIRIARETMEPVFSFIDEQRDGPFFVWFAPQLPHLPHNPPAEYRELYASLGGTWFTPGYYASISWFDAAVGQLLHHLEERGLRERTLVVYLADNGWQAPADGVEYDFLLGGAKGKLSLYELGFRTPILFSWPGVISAGETRDELVSTADLFPTLLDYAGVPRPPNRTGVDLRPIFEGEPLELPTALIGSAASLREDRPGEPRGGSFVRTPRWHYLWYADGREALFDIAADPDEEHDVSRAHPDVVRQARAQIRRWTESMIESADASAGAAGVY
jgi:arylsulfatase A-like enzyme